MRGGRRCRRLCCRRSRQDVVPERLHAPAAAPCPSALPPDRKLLLKYHPDKMASPVAESDSLFLSIQKAYDTLSDESRRRAYDSQFDFDERIPKGDETTDFYAVCAPRPPLALLLMLLLFFV